MLSAHVYCWGKKRKKGTEILIVSLGFFAVTTDDVLFCATTVPEQSEVGCDGFSGSDVRRRYRAYAANPGSHWPTGA